MKGLITDCKTGKTKQIDDGLPFPQDTLEPEPPGLDLVQASQKLEDLDHLKSTVAKLQDTINKIHPS